MGKATKILNEDKARQALREILEIIGEFAAEDVDGELLVNTGSRQVPIDIVDAKAHLCFNEKQQIELHYALFEHLGWLAPEIGNINELTVDRFIELMRQDGCFDG